MALLIGAGSALSWTINRGAGPIALASFVAFSVSAIMDSISYSLLRDREYLVKVNGSNIVGAFFDSLLFPWLAFGGVMIWVSAGQFIAKISGGFLWALLLKRLKAEK